MNGWDVYAAELADTMRGGKDSRPRRSCIYCGKLTRALGYVCTAHDDLPALETAAVPRTSSPDVSAAAASSAALLSSEPQPPVTSGGSAHGTRGVESRPQPLRRGSSGVAALTFMEAE